MVLMYSFFFIHSIDIGHFDILAIINNATTNMRVNRTFPTIDDLQRETQEWDCKHP